MPSATITHVDPITPRRGHEPELGEEFGRRLRKRDPEALERFFGLYFDSIYARVHKFVGQRQAAEDLTQDIFLKIHGSLPRFDPARHLGPWVRTITLNTIRDHWRARRTVRAADWMGAGDSFPERTSEPPELGLERRERDEEVKRAVYRLPLNMRSVLLLRIFDGLSFGELASLIKVTPAAARKRYSRALRRLRDDLTPRGARP